MPTHQPTVDELVKTIQHSSLPTLAVEGEDDMTVFHYLERLLSPIGADVLPCGNRSQLLQVYGRRAEFSDR